MRNLRLFLLSLLLLSPLAWADGGIINVKSASDVKSTADKLENALKSKGMTVFTRINHSEGASGVGMSLRPTELIIFGNPKIGSRLMACAQSVGIDLPQKALIYEDESGQTWLSYNSPQHLAERHGIEECGEVLGKVEGALANFAKAATQ